MITLKRKSLTESTTRGRCFLTDPRTSRRISRENSLPPQAAANFYQRALLANALTSALRLHQRLPRFQLSRAFLAQALQEDSCHYLLYSLILVNSYPITSMLPTKAECFCCHQTLQTVNLAICLDIICNLLDCITLCQCYVCFLLQFSLLLPFIYYRFLTLRYTSRRNPYCRTLFTELRILLEHFIMKPACPAFLRRMCLSSIAFVAIADHDGVITCFGMKKGEAVVSLCMSQALTCSCVQVTSTITTVTARTKTTSFLETKLMTSHVYPQKSFLTSSLCWLAKTEFSESYR
ncbi:hypothetical protein GOODEAATRI_001260 [Goodea atripinnis]|uniref:Uncharacterized protein n=1 Tax=Goodea atripinnis TaxID=208336 RepID=A0ABV0MGW9_9TELE